MVITSGSITLAIISSTTAPLNENRQLTRISTHIQALALAHDEKNHKEMHKELIELDNLSCQWGFRVVQTALVSNPIAIYQLTRYVLIFDSLG